MKSGCYPWDSTKSKSVFYYFIILLARVEELCIYIMESLGEYTVVSDH